jgi:hypothetical protein
MRKASMVGFHRYVRVTPTEEASASNELMKVSQDEFYPRKLS